MKDIKSEPSNSRLHFFDHLYFFGRLLPPVHQGDTVPPRNRRILGRVHLGYDRKSTRLFIPLLCIGKSLIMRLCPLPTIHPPRFSVVDAFQACRRTLCRERGQATTAKARRRCWRRRCSGAGRRGSRTTITSRLGLWVQGHSLLWLPTSRGSDGVGLLKHRKKHFFPYGQTL
jgi:hypothetical protein